MPVGFGSECSVSGGLVDLWTYIFIPQPSAAELHAYWESSQEFFACLNLPSLPSAWAPIEEALPDSIFSERCKVVIVAFCMNMAAWSRKLFSVPRSLTQRLRRLRPHWPPSSAHCDQLEAAYSPGTPKPLMVVHPLGNPFDLATTLFCRRHNLWLVEDKCDALCLPNHLS